MCLPQPETFCGYKMAVRHRWFTALQYLCCSKDIFTCQFDIKYSTVICWKISLCCLWVMVPMFFPLCNGFCVSVCAFSAWSVQDRSSLAAFSQKKPDLIVVLWFTANCPCWSHVFPCIWLFWGEFLYPLRLCLLLYFVARCHTEKLCGFKRRDCI